MEKTLIETLREIDPTNAEYINKVFQDNDLNVNHLLLLTNAHIKDVIPKLNVRVEFESKLNEWRNYIDNTPSTSKHRINVVSLKSTLGSEYDNLLSTYKETKMLVESSRRTIANSIFRYCHFNKICITNRVLEDLASQISTIFPSESKETWFSKNGKVAGRLLFKKYNFSRQKEKNTKTTPKENATDVKLLLTEDQEQEMKKYQMWLLTQKANVQEIISVWKTTSLYRLSIIKKKEKDESIVAILSEWPSYKLPIGYNLLEIDYNQMYPNLEKHSFKKWPEFVEKIVKYYEKNVKEKLCQSMLTLVGDESVSIESRDATLLYILHSIIKPSSTKIDGNCTRYSIRDSQRSFIKLIDKPSDLENQQNVHPYIFVQGDSFLDVKHIYVCYENIIYKVDSILEALTTCFYVYIIFNFKYPNASRNVWKFLQSYLFGLDYAKEKLCNTILSLKKYLEQ